MKTSRWIVLALAVLPLTACKWLPKRAGCDKPGDYQAAQNMPPLKVPAGLDAPDTRAAMPIPDITEPEKPRQAGDACLDAPPRYSTPRPAKTPPKQPQ